MARIWFITKCLTWLGLIGGLTAFFYLGEFASVNNDLVGICREKNIPLPIPNARIVVSSGALTMHLYSGETLLKSYDIAIGPGLPGVGLMRQGTPFGEYTITEKHEREDLVLRGSRYFVLSYPTSAVAADAADRGVIDDDTYRAICEAEKEKSTPPTVKELGGPLCLQGGYFFYRNARFTDGAVALSNSDIVEIFDAIDVGATVIVRE